jgi:hypothetical protein
MACSKLLNHKELKEITQKAQSIIWEKVGVEHL